MNLHRFSPYLKEHFVDFFVLFWFFLFFLVVETDGLVMNVNMNICTIKVLVLMMVLRQVI